MSFASEGSQCRLLSSIVSSMLLRYASIAYLSGARQSSKDQNMQCIIWFSWITAHQNVKFCAKNHCYFRCYRAQASWASSGKLTCEGSAVQSSACSCKLAEWLGAIVSRFVVKKQICALKFFSSNENVLQPLTRVFSRQICVCVKQLSI